RSEVVVVKGKLKLCSISGLIAVLGILVLLVGVLMAVLGYWPRNGLFFRSQPQEGATMALMSFSSATPALVQVKDFWRNSWIGKQRNMPIGHVILTSDHQDMSGSLFKYLYSDRLKVFGPLIMGIGIFLFICANAVLHENRDKKTKVINLRDIYSTVIDLHSIRKPHPSSGSTHQSSVNPLNGLINYVQSKSLDSKSRTCPVTLLSSRQPASRRGSSDGGGGVFSIYQEQLHTSHPSSCDRHSLPQTSNPCWTSHHKKVLSSFTLPRPRQRSPGPRRRHSFWAGSSWEEDEHKKEIQPPPLCASTPPPQRGSEIFLLLSASSLSSVSHLLSSSSSTPVPPCRRRSLPTAAFNTAYSKLTQGEEESFGWSSSPKVTPEGWAQHSQVAHTD
ncbi:hypothetical protein XENOCAPTIV_015671, partial [Xenoophorus captivus]